MSIFDLVYAKLPVWAQHGVVTAYGYYWKRLRFGPGYEQYLLEYQSRERFSFQEWQVWQAERLRSLLPACVYHVPYYRQSWTDGQKQAALKGSLESIPLLDKDPVRAAPHNFLREDLHPFQPQVFLTSGSTGTPISSYYTLQELRQSLALREARSANWAGVSFEMPRSTFSGRMVEPDPRSTGPFYRYNFAERQVYFSPFHLRPDTAFRYVQALRNHKIQWGTGYAVSYYLLARLMLEQDISNPKLDAVITTSEKLLPEMRSIIEQAFGCRVYEEYSTVENAVFASECEYSHLHISPDVSVVEIIRPDGSPCEPGEAGEVVVTSLTREYQPLIRFRLGDVAILDPDPCPCGRKMPVIKDVVGRIEDVVIGPDGRQMVRFHGVFVNQPHVREGQVIQESLNFVRVKVVPVNGFCETDEKDIVKRVQQRLGPTVRVQVEQVAEIPRTKAGKFQAVISKLKKS